MRTGFSVFLLAVGAVLTFAVHKTVSGLDIRTVGVVLMAAGALGLAITALVFAPRSRNSVVHERTVTAQPTVAAPVNTYATSANTYATPVNGVTAERVETHEVY